MNRRFVARMVLLTAITCAANSFGRAAGQCMEWDAAVALPYAVYDLRVLDMGSGQRLFVANNQGVGQWTGTTWVGMGGEPFDDLVFSMYAFNDGTGPTLYAGGYFQRTYLNQYPVFHIAKLVNSTWTQVGNYGLPAFSSSGVTVDAMIGFDDGNGMKLYVGGVFHTIGFSSDSIATWDGTSWSGVGGGLTGAPPYLPHVFAMCIFDDGAGPALYVCGQFLTAGGISVNHIAKWNGTNWAALGTGLTYQGGPNANGASGMTVFDDGSGPALYVCGFFDTAGGVPAMNIAKWDGIQWAALSGLQGTPAFSASAIAVHDDGNGPALYVGATAYIGQSQARGVVRWDGHTWSDLGGGFVGSASGMQSFDDGQGRGPALYVGGQIVSPFGGNLQSGSFSRWYSGCTHRSDPMCLGDGTFSMCPCSNYGATHHGCANSASSQGALLSHSGTQSPDTFVLHASYEPSTSLSIFLQSTTLRPVEAPFGAGILCLGGQILRMYAKVASSGVATAPDTGDLSITQRAAVLGDPIAPGSARYYQVWYRDGTSGFCSPASFNVSNGLRVVW